MDYVAGLDDRGNKVSSGVYFCRFLGAGDETKKGRVPFRVPGHSTTTPVLTSSTSLQQEFIANQASPPVHTLLATFHMHSPYQKQHEVTIILTHLFTAG